MRVGHRAALPYQQPKPAGEESTTPEAYDPGGYTTAEVVAYASDHPDELDAIYQAEVDGRARSGLLAQLEQL